jgi:hypothetical protein
MKNFIIFPDNKNEMQLKNQAKKSNKTSDLKYNDILNNLSKELTGLSFNKAIKKYKIESPMYDELQEILFIPIKVGNNIFKVAIVEQKNEDFNGTKVFILNQKDTSIKDFEFKIENKFIDIKYGSFKKELNGWKIRFNEEEYLSLEIIEDGFVLLHNVVEYDDLHDGYSTINIKSDYLNFTETPHR